jgi:hypothetical protein
VGWGVRNSPAFVFAIARCRRSLARSGPSRRPESHPGHLDPLERETGVEAGKPVIMVMMPEED